MQDSTKALTRFVNRENAAGPKGHAAVVFIVLILAIDHQQSFFTDFATILLEGFAEQCSFQS